MEPLLRSVGEFFVGLAIRRTMTGKLLRPNEKCALGFCLADTTRMTNSRTKPECSFQRQYKLMSICLNLCSYILSEEKCQPKLQ